MLNEPFIKQLKFCKHHLELYKGHLDNVYRSTTQYFKSIDTATQVAALQWKFA